MSKLNIPRKITKTKTISFRATPDTSKKLTYLRNKNKIRTGDLFEYMITYFYNETKEQ
jgi:hypothetical protein